MRVLLIANFKKGVGGISGQVEILQKKLKEEGVVCDIVSTGGSAGKRLQAIVYILFHGNSYDTFHIHACSGRGFFPAIVGVISGRLLRKRIVLTYHGGGAEGFFARRPRLVHYFLTRTSTNIVLSEFVGHVFYQHNLPFTIIPNIIELDESHFHPRSVLHPRFISIRTLEQNYNVGCTLRAFQTVKKQLPEATLTILGDGPQRAELEAFVKDHHLTDVTFYGRVDNQEIYSYLERADIMISSPRIDNMPVSVLECFNAGLLVISSKVGGVPYMIEDGTNGLLYDYNDDMMLAEKMLWCISHQQASTRMISNARDSLQQYSWTSIKKKLFGIYQS